MGSRFFKFAQSVFSSKSSFPIRAISDWSRTQNMNLGSKLSANTKFYAISVSTVLAGMTALTYMSHISKKMPVIAPSVLEGHPEASRCVISMSECLASGTQVNPGRSGGHKVERTNPETNKTDYFYYKETFNRNDLIKELTVGALGKELFGDSFPDVFLCEIPQDPKSHTSQYALLSSSVHPSIPHSNLESWAIKYVEDNELREYAPRHLGTSIAFDLLMGKTDCKLANLVGILDKEGYCYSIDHESAFRTSAFFVTDASEALERIGEFVPKSLADYGHEENCPALNTNDDPDRPLKDKPHIRDAVKPILLNAIGNDLESGHILNLYEKFAAIPQEKFKQIISKYNFLTDSEISETLSKFAERQQEAKQFLVENAELTSSRRFVR